MRAALRSGDTVTSGQCHVDCMSGMTAEQLDGPLEIGWLDAEGNFVSERPPERSTFLVRHAQSEQNAGVTRAFDSQLTDAGVQQAVRLGKSLFGMAPMAGLVSPFLRCLQTAEIIQVLTGIEFTVVPDLGEWPGRVESHRDLFPTFAWPAGDHFESHECDDWRAAAERVAAGLPSRAILVTHGGVVWTLAGLLTGREMDPNTGVPNASLSLICDRRADYLFRTLS